ncbi:MAG: alanine racemase [Protaetiibacter sp.]
MIETAKGLPAADSLDSLRLARASLLEGELVTPVLTIDEPALRRNIAEMAGFLAPLGVELAPHVKTHMSPEIWKLQEEAGASCCTVATVAQALVFVAAGARRILLASEVVAEGDLRALALAVLAHPGLDVTVFCDSVRGVVALDRALTKAGGGASLHAVVDVGVPGWRTGCRTLGDALEVAHAITGSAHLTLVGTAGYEGVLWSLTEGRDTAVTDYLRLATTVHLALFDAGMLPAAPMLSFGGSDLYPAVLEHVLPVARATGSSLLLRSGCYLFHDHGKYERAQNEVASSRGKPRFEPAIAVWAPIVSAPEPHLAVAGLGRRDAGHDAGLPQPLRRYRDRELSPVTGAASRSIYDQHLVVDDPHGCLEVGDLVEFGISHPCTTLDRWHRAILVDGLAPTGVVELAFP